MGAKYCATSKALGMEYAKKMVGKCASILVQTNITFVVFPAVMEAESGIKNPAACVGF